MGKARTQEATKISVTLDNGALVALDRGNKRMIALLQQVRASRARFRVPAGVVAQACRDGTRQAVLARFLRLSDVQIRPLDTALARACGQLCAAAGTSDVIDASVVVTARERGDSIVSGDAIDMLRLDPDAHVLRI